VHRGRADVVLALLRVERECAPLGARGHALLHGCGAGQVLCGGAEPGASGVAEVGVALPERHHAGDGDDEQQEHHLERQELAGQGAGPRQAPV
jgi:hypothetical protein